MKQSFISQTFEKESFTILNSVRHFSFITIKSRDNYALLAERQQISFDFSFSRGESALFQETDCFECLSPTQLLIDSDLFQQKLVA